MSSRQQSWTTLEEQFLRKYAGVLTRREICYELRRSTQSVKTKAKRLGISLRCFKSKLTWCDQCAKWRTSISPVTGHCRVCAKRDMLARSEERVSEALQYLNLDQRTVYLQEEAHRGTRQMPPKPLKQASTVGSLYAHKKAEELYQKDLESWEISCLDLLTNANKTRLKRIRQKLGTNPRKNLNKCHFYTKSQVKL